MTDCQIDTDMSILFPDSYIDNNTERLRLYRILDNIKTHDDLHSFEKEMEDRFGPIPESSRELMNVVRLRWKAIQLGFEKIILKRGYMVIHFVSNPESPYFSSAVFRSVLNFVQQQGRDFKMKESKGKLSLSSGSVSTVTEAIEILDQNSRING